MGIRSQKINEFTPLFWYSGLTATSRRSTTFSFPLRGFMKCLQPKGKRRPLLRLSALENEEIVIPTPTRLSFESTTTHTSSRRNMPRYKFI